VHYRRLNVLGFQQETTSVGEAMHSSMKSGASGVRPGMNLDVTANCMMDKAQRNGQQKGNYAADQVSRNKLWSESGTATHITDFSEKSSEEEWRPSATCKVIEVEAGIYLVFTPGKFQSA
jgi:hypothetical protein